MWADLPTNVEVLDPYKNTPSPHPRATGIVADSHEEINLFVSDNLSTPPSDIFFVFCDGSQQDAGTGAAAVASDGSHVKLRLGNQDHYTLHEI